MNDLVKSVETYQALKLKYMEVSQKKDGISITEFEKQRAELVRSEGENAELHRRLIGSQEEIQRLTLNSQLEQQQLRDQLEDLKVLQAAETLRWRQVLRENEVLKQKHRDLMHITQLEQQGVSQPRMSGDVMADFHQAVDLSRGQNDASSDRNAEKEEQIVAQAQEIATLRSAFHQAEAQISQLERLKAAVKQIPHNFEEERIKKESMEDRAKLEKKNKQLESQVDFLNEQYENLKRQHAELGSKVTNTTQDRHELVQAKSQLESRVSDLEEELKRQYKTALEAMTFTQAANFDHLKQSEEQKALITKLQNTNEQLEREIDFKKSDLERAERIRVQQVEPLQERLRLEVQQRAAQEGEMETKLHGLQMELERAQNDIKSLTTHKAELETRLTITEESSARSMREAGDRKTEMEKALMNTVLAKKQVAELEGQIAFLTQNMEALNGEKGSMASYLEEKRQLTLEMEKEAMTLNQEKTNLHAQIAALEVARKGLMDDIQQQKIQRAHSERDLQFLRVTEIPQLRKTNETIQKQLATSEEVAKVVQEQHRALSLDFEKTTSDLYQLRMERQELEEEAKKAREENRTRVLEYEKRIEEMGVGLQEAKRLEEQVKKLQEAEALKGSYLEQDNAELLAQIRHFEDQMSHLNARVEELNMLTEHSQKEVAGETLKIKAKDNQLETVRNELEGTKKREELERQQRADLENEIKHLQSTLELRMRDIAEAEAFKSHAMGRSAEAEQLQTELREKVRELEAQKMHTEAHFRVKESHEEQLASEKDALHLKTADLGNQIVQMTTLLHSSEQIREQLVKQVEESQAVLTQERHMHEETRAVACARESQLVELHEQTQGLRDALTRVDQERDELQHEADRKAEELAKKSEDVQVTLEALEKVENALEDARRQYEFQSRELLAREEALEALHNTEDQLAKRAGTLEATLEVAEQEKHAHEEDLRHLCAENQILNEKLKDLHMDRHTLSLHSDDMHTDKARLAAQLQSTLAERDDVLEMYKHQIDTTERQQKQIDVLLGEKNDLIAATHEAQRNTHEVEHELERARTEQRNLEVDVLTLQQQMSNLTRTCEEQTKDKEKLHMEQTNVTQDLEQAEAARMDIQARAMEEERECLRVKTTLEQERARAGDMARSLEEAEASVQMERLRIRQLEELIAKLRLEAGVRRDGEEVTPRDIGEHTPGHCCNEVARCRALIAELETENRDTREKIRSLQKTAVAAGWPEMSMAIACEPSSPSQPSTRRIITPISFAPGPQPDNPAYPKSTTRSPRSGITTAQSVKAGSLSMSATNKSFSPPGPPVTSPLSSRTPKSSLLPTTRTFPYVERSNEADTTVVVNPMSPCTPPGRGPGTGAGAGERLIKSPESDLMFGPFGTPMGKKNLGKGRISEGAHSTPDGTPDWNGPTDAEN